MELMICIWESKLIIAGLLLAGYSLFHLGIESQKSDFKSVFLWLMMGKEEGSKNKGKPGIILLIWRPILLASCLVSLIAISIIDESNKDQFLYLLGAIYVPSAFRKIKSSEEAYNEIRKIVQSSLGKKKSDEKIAYAKYETYIFGGDMYILAVGGVLVGAAVSKIWEINTLNSMEGFVVTWITIFITFYAIERTISSYRAKAFSAVEK